MRPTRRARRSQARDPVDERDEVGVRRRRRERPAPVRPLGADRAPPAPRLDRARVQVVRERVQVPAGGATEDRRQHRLGEQCHLPDGRDPERAQPGLAEMRRVVRPGGVVAVCMWDRDGMEMLAAVRRAQEALGDRGPAGEADIRYRSREEIESLFGDGFEELETELLEVESGYTGYEDFWDALLGGAGPAGAWVASLGEERRQKAHDEVFRQLGGPPGQFRLRAQAWATRARRT